MIDNKTKYRRLTICNKADSKYYKVVLGTVIQDMRYLQHARGPTWITTT